MKKLLYVSMPWATGGVVVNEEGVIEEAPPVWRRWMVGMTEKELREAMEEEGRICGYPDRSSVEGSHQVTIFGRPQWILHGVKAKIVTLKESLRVVGFYYLESQMDQLLIGLRELEKSMTEPRHPPNDLG